MVSTERSCRQEKGFFIPGKAEEHSIGRRELTLPPPWRVPIILCSPGSEAKAVEGFKSGSAEAVPFGQDVKTKQNKTKKYAGSAARTKVNFGNFLCIYCNFQCAIIV